MTRTSCIYIILSVYFELSDRSLLLLLWTDVKQRLWLSQSVLCDVAPSSKCNLYASADISVRWHKGCWILMANPGRITRPATAHYVIITLAFQMTGGVSRNSYNNICGTTTNLVVLSSSSSCSETRGCWRSWRNAGVPALSIGSQYQWQSVHGPVVPRRCRHSIVQVRNFKHLKWIFQ